MSADDFLLELSKLTGIPMAFDETRRCTLICGDGLNVEIADLPNAGAVLLTAPLLSAPPVDRAGTYAFALEYAHDLDRTKGAAISIDPSAGGRLEIQFLRRIDELDAAGFCNAVGGFITTAREARDAFSAHLAKGGSDSAASAPPADDGFAASSDFHLRV